MDRDKVIKGLECCVGYEDASNEFLCVFEKDNPNCPYSGTGSNEASCMTKLMRDALALLKAQEPRLLTEDDFIDNLNMDSQGFIPAWIEYRRDGEWGEYWADDDDEWTSVRVDNFEGYGYRCWTSRPTDEQKDKVKWE